MIQQAQLKPFRDALAQVETRRTALKNYLIRLIDESKNKSTAKLNRVLYALISSAPDDKMPIKRSQLIDPRWGPMFFPGTEIKLSQGSRLRRKIIEFLDKSKQKQPLVEQPAPGSSDGENLLPINNDSEKFQDDNTKTKEAVSDETDNKLQALYKQSVKKIIGAKLLCQYTKKELDELKTKCCKIDLRKEQQTVKNKVKKNLVIFAKEVSIDNITASAWLFNNSLKTAFTKGSELEKSCNDLIHHFILLYRLAQINNSELTTEDTEEQVKNLFMNFMLKHCFDLLEEVFLQEGQEKASGGCHPLYKSRPLFEYTKLLRKRKRCQLELKFTEPNSRLKTEVGRLEKYLLIFRHDEIFLGFKGAQGKYQEEKLNLENDKVKKLIDSLQYKINEKRDVTIDELDKLGKIESLIKKYRGHTNTNSQPQFHPATYYAKYIDAFQCFDQGWSVNHTTDKKNNVEAFNAELKLNDSLPNYIVKDWKNIIKRYVPQIVTSLETYFDTLKSEMTQTQTQISSVDTYIDNAINAIADEQAERIQKNVSKASIPTWEQEQKADWGNAALGVFAFFSVFLALTPIVGLLIFKFADAIDNAWNSPEDNNLPPPKKV